MTHACGYEHPCQVEMSDVDISCGDNNRTISMDKAYGYSKTVVPFEGMDAIFRCVHLGGLKQAENIMNRNTH